MPSDIAKQIVQQVFGGDKAAAVDSINDALGASTYDAIQARKVEFAKKEKTNLDLCRRTLDQLVKKKLVENKRTSTDKSVENRYRKLH